MPVDLDDVEMEPLVEPGNGQPRSRMRKVTFVVCLGVVGTVVLMAAAIPLAAHKQVAQEASQLAVASADTANSNQASLDLDLVKSRLFPEVAKTVVHGCPVASTVAQLRPEHLTGRWYEVLSASTSDHGIMDGWLPQQCRCLTVDFDMDKDGVSGMVSYRCALHTSTYVPYTKLEGIIEEKQHQKGLWTLKMKNNPFIHMHWSVPLQSEDYVIIHECIPTSSVHVPHRYTIRVLSRHPHTIDTDSWEIIKPLVEAADINPDHVSPVQIPQNRCFQEK